MLSKAMDYPLKLIETEECFAVCCSALPGCWSQGRTEAEALENIRDAIAEYLAARAELREGDQMRYVTVG